MRSAALTAAAEQLASLLAQVTSRPYSNPFDSLSLSEASGERLQPRATPDLPINWPTFQGVAEPEITGGNP